MAGEKRLEIENWGKKAVILGGPSDNDKPEVVENEESEILVLHDDDEGVDFVDREK